MSELLNYMESGSAVWTASLWQASWQGAIVIGAAWAVAHYCTFLSPRVVCWLWRLVCIKLLALLVWAQPIEIPLLPATPMPIVAESVDRAPVRKPLGSISTTSSETRGAAEAERRAPLPWFTMVLVLWTVGVLWRLSMTVRESRFADTLRRSASPLDDDRFGAIYRLEAERLGLRHPPRVCTSDQATGPLLAGIWRPVIILPQELLQTLDMAEVRLILAHELAHFKRRDLAWNWLPTLVSWLFFFHPLTRVLAHCWSECQESACDELVIQRTAARSSDYGRMLVKLASDSRSGPRAMLVTAGVLGNYRHLERRILAMTRVKPFSRARIFAAAAIVAIVAGAGIVPWRVVAQEPTPTGSVNYNYVIDQSDASQKLGIIGRALHKYHDTHKHFPASYTKAPDGKPLLSWRVALLPFLNGNAKELYSQFHLDEPWDSPHNKGLISKHSIYQSPLAKNVPAGSTIYLAASGGSTVFPPGQSVTVREIIDGTSKTIAIVEVDDAHAVPWTKPEDWEFSTEHPALGLGGHTKDGFLALAADASVHLIPKATDPKLLSQLFTRNGREPVNWPEQADAIAKTLRETTNELKVIGIGLHNYHDTHKSFPASYTTDAGGKPLLSWRVTLLPSLESDAKNLYSDFHLNEPWDSEHNRTLIDKMPAEYRCPLVPNVARGSTVYLGSAGEATMFPPGQPTAARNTIDGLSNTVAVVVVDEKHAVPWTKPSDWEFDPQAPARGLLTVADDSRFVLLFADGAIHLIRRSLDAKTLGALFTRNGRDDLDRKTHTYIFTE